MNKLEIGAAVAATGLLADSYLNESGVAVSLFDSLGIRMSELGVGTIEDCAVLASGLYFLSKAFRKG